MNFANKVFGIEPRLPEIIKDVFLCKFASNHYYNLIEVFIYIFVSVC